MSHQLSRTKSLDRSARGASRGQPNQASDAGLGCHGRTPTRARGPVPQRPPTRATGHAPDASLRATPQGTNADDRVCVGVHTGMRFGAWSGPLLLAGESESWAVAHSGHPRLEGATVMGSTFAIFLACFPIVLVLVTLLAWGPAIPLSRGCPIPGVDSAAVDSAAKALPPHTGNALACRETPAVSISNSPAGIGAFPVSPMMSFVHGRNRAVDRRLAIRRLAAGRRVGRGRAARRVCPSTRAGSRGSRCGVPRRQGSSRTGSPW
jgi:hypothetical protein